MNLDPRETLETMLSLLGFFCQVEETRTENSITLQVYSAEKDRLIGRDGHVLEEIQILLNRMLQAQENDAPKIQVDVEHYRAMQEHELVARIRNLADTVRRTGTPLELEPMNAYERRLIHNAFAEDPEITTCSTPHASRLKRLVLKRRN
jgi:spoIIIJ-associated protein